MVDPSPDRFYLWVPLSSVVESAACEEENGGQCIEGSSDPTAQRGGKSHQGEASNECERRHHQMDDSAQSGRGKCDDWVLGGARRGEIIE